VLAALLPAAKAGGRPRSVKLRRVINGLFSLVRAGCAWRYVPRDYGAWSRVYHYPYFRLWRTNGTWERGPARLRALARQRAGRESTPRAALIARPIGEAPAGWSARM
jgi:putative transposase